MNKEIIDKVLDGKASTEEQGIVSDWFATDEGQEYLSQRLDEESEQMGEEEVERWAGGHIPSHRMKQRFLSAVRQEHRHTLKWWRVAAILIPFLLLASTAAFLAEKAGVFSTSQYAEIVVPCGERMQVILQDGTAVELNSATTLRYPKKFGLFSRKVEISGEGYFSVAKESGRPFTVQTQGVDVKVTGTQFNVKAYPEDTQIYVTLTEGGVLLNEQYALKPGENATYDCQTGTFHITQIADMESIEAWRTNSLNFYLTPLREIIKVMERQYDTQFIVADSTLLDSRYTLSTSKVNVRDVLRDLETVSHVEFMEQGENLFEVRRKSFVSH